jgi:NAD-dependent deacetylase
MSQSPIVIDPQTRVFVLTGAGVSAESGVATFRGSSGLWENHRVEDVASPEGFRKDPALVWRFYSERRAAAKHVTPNPGHVALARLEEQLGDRFLLATQNVDGLHARAGSVRVVEMHGSLWKTRCSRCARPAFDDASEYADGRLPGCGQCDARGEFALLRPHIVWFGEGLAASDMDRIDGFLSDEAGGRLVFLACGTSGTVYPAAGLVKFARARGAETWLVNQEIPENARYFDQTRLGRSGEILPGLFEVVG